MVHVAARVQVDYRGRRYQPGEVFRVPKVDAAILAYKRKVRLLTTRERRAYQTTALSDVETVSLASDSLLPSEWDSVHEADPDTRAVEEAIVSPDEEESASPSEDEAAEPPKRRRSPKRRVSEESSD